jgi:hypothetical protein
MKGRKMIATEVIEREQQTEDFTIQLDRFRQAVRDGREAEASIIQLDVLARHGAWID